MTTLTLTLDDQVFSAAQRVAEQRHTTVDVLVGDYVKTLVKDDKATRARAAEELMRTIDELSRDLSSARWTNRDELYDR